MAAKLVTTYRAHFDFATKECADRFIASTCGKGVVTEHQVHRCPYCGAPWPRHRSEPHGPFSIVEFKKASEYEWLSGYTYCCEATKAECEAVK